MRWDRTRSSETSASSWRLQRLPLGLLLWARSERATTAVRICSFATAMLRGQNKQTGWRKQPLRVGCGTMTTSPIQRPGGSVMRERGESEVVQPSEMLSLADSPFIENPKGGVYGWTVLSRGFFSNTQPGAAALAGKRHNER